MPRIRNDATIVASLLVAATTAVTALAAPKKAKPDVESTASSAAKKTKKKPPKTAKKTTTTESKSASKSSDVGKKDEAKKDAPKKDAAPPDQPPIELTGALPQAKLADKKPKAKDEKGDAKDAKKELAEKDEKKSLFDKDEKKADTKKTTKKKIEAAGIELGASSKKAIGEKPKVKTCLHAPVTFSRLGQPDVAFVLTTCKGAPAPGAVDYLSVVARPYDASPPPSWIEPVGVLTLPSKAVEAKAEKTFAKAIADAKGSIPSMKRLDPGLVTRLQKIADHFGGKPITIVSGYRKQQKASLHKEGRALDVRIDGVTNEALVAFCKALEDTGCGYYPNSFFVHVDVRNPGAGHVTWIDVSGPGAAPKYVSSWPLPDATPKLPPLPEKKDSFGALPSLPAPMTNDVAIIESDDDASTETKTE